MELEDFLVGTWTQISGNQLKDGKDGAATEKLHGCSDMQKDIGCDVGRSSSVVAPKEHRILEHLDAQQPCYRSYNCTKNDKKKAPTVQTRSRVPVQGFQLAVMTPDRQLTATTCQSKRPRP